MVYPPYSNFGLVWARNALPDVPRRSPALPGPLSIIYIFNRLTCLHSVDSPEMTLPAPSSPQSSAVLAMSLSWLVWATRNATSVTRLSPREVSISEKKLLYEREGQPSLLNGSVIPLHFCTKPPILASNASNASNLSSMLSLHFLLLPLQVSSP